MPGHISTSFSGISIMKIQIHKRTRGVNVLSKGISWFPTAKRCAWKLGTFAFKHLLSFIGSSYMLKLIRLSLKGIAIIWLLVIIHVFADTSINKQVWKYTQVFMQFYLLQYTFSATLYLVWGLTLINVVSLSTNTCS